MMTNEQQQNLKKMAEDMSGSCGSTLRANYAQQQQQAQGNMAAAPSLRERVANQLHRARQEAVRRERLEELQYLLDKHPEVARMLELLEAVQA